MKVQAKLVKFYAPFDLVSQSNLIIEDLIAKLHLPLISYPYPYS